MFKKGKNLNEIYPKTLIRNSVMENIISMSNSFSLETQDSETLKHWYSYLEGLTYDIKNVISHPRQYENEPFLKSFQLNRISDFLESMENHDFSRALYEIHTILMANQSMERISREEFILIYLLIKIAINQFSIRSTYLIKSSPSNVPIASK